MEPMQPDELPSNTKSLNSELQSEKVHLHTAATPSSLQEYHTEAAPFATQKTCSTVQKLAAILNLSYDAFAGEMRKRGCSEPTALKIWLGLYEHFTDFNDNDIYLSNLRKAADVLKVKTGALLPQ